MYELFFKVQFYEFAMKKRPQESAARPEECVCPFRGYNRLGQRWVTLFGSRAKLEAKITHAVQ